VNVPTSVDAILALYDQHGAKNYGENVTQIDHALQCANLAVDAGASDDMIAAALLHDVGHLVSDTQDAAGADLDVNDDDHEAVGARILAPIFGPAVARPVALHVTAKRWRCTTEPAYYERLSPASRKTLLAQGGLLSDDECRRFEAHPGFKEALLLREWDDSGKIVGDSATSLAPYEPLLRRLAR